MLRNRPPHWIKHDRRRGTPKRILFLNCWSHKRPIENEQGNSCGDAHTFAGCVARFVQLENGKVVRQSDCHYLNAEDLWAEMPTFTSRRESLWVIAHGAAYSYTLLGLWEKLLTCDLSKQSILLGSPPFLVTARIAGGRIRFIDSRNYFRCSISELVATFHDIDHVGAYQALGTFGPGGRAELELQAVAGMMVRLIGDWEKKDRGKFAITSPGLAWNHWRGRHIYSMVHVHGDSEVTELEREACHAARQEVFQSGEYGGQCYLLDFRSCYPFLMRDRLYPVRLVDAIVRPEVTEVLGLLDKMGVIARVKLSSSEFGYPVKAANGVRWCYSPCESTLAGSELHEAILAGHVESVDRAAIYDLDWCLSSFAEDWIEERDRCRKKKDTRGELIAKTISNCLYSMFARKSDGWEAADDVASPFPFGDFRVWREGIDGDGEDFRSICWRTYRRIERHDWKHAFPAISAYCLAYARSLLGGSIRIAGLHRVLWCNTDAIIVTQDGYDRLKNANKVTGRIGELRLVDAGDGCTIQGIGTYAIGRTRRIAGQRGTGDIGTDNAMIRDCTQHLQQIVSDPLNREVRIYKHYLGKKVAAKWENRKAVLTLEEMRSG